MESIAKVGPAVRSEFAAASRVTCSCPTRLKRKGPKRGPIHRMKEGLSVPVITANQPLPETAVGLEPAGVARATRLPWYLQRLSIRHGKRLLIEARAMH